MTDLALSSELVPAGNLLRVLTCGSVDDGKSTLIGRLLYDTRSLFDDHLRALQADSRKFGTTGDNLDLALLVDGLEAEREQGITIDVAHRFFSTPRRSFVIADTPGHEQYTRNMATGASNSDLAIILIDAGKGILPQTRRHSYICSLLGIRHAVLAINKIDLVDFSEQQFDAITAVYMAFARDLKFKTVTTIPVSALHGDNVVVTSPNTPWYRGPTLLSYLEQIEIKGDALALPFRFPVQWINRAGGGFRGAAGTVASGTVAVNDVVVTGSGRHSKVARIVTADGDLPHANAGDAVTILLDDDVDVSRGEMLAKPDARPLSADQLAAHIIWMSDDELLPGREYLMRCGNRWVSATVTALKHKVDVNTFSQLAARTLHLNDIAFCNIATATPILFDSYETNRATGAFILVDRISNTTAAAGMIAYELRRASNIHREYLLVDRAARAAAKHQRPTIVWLTGLSGSGKSTIAKLVEQKLYELGQHTFVLDGDNLRHGLNHDLGFTDAARVENIRRAGEVAKLFVEAGLIVICSFISPFEAERRMVRGLVNDGEFIEVFVDTPLAECIRRDPKGLYAKAKAGQLTNFTGIDSAYEYPDNPDIRIDTTTQTPNDAADAILNYLRRGQFIGG